MSKAKLRESIVAVACVIVASASAVGLKASGYYVARTGQTLKRKIPIYRVEREDSLASISFDCAWGADNTIKILDALDFYGVKCTFFVVQFWAEKYPEVLKEISARGHEIGTHSKTHPKMSTLSKEQIEQELVSSCDAVERIVGKRPTLFRPPFGDYDDSVIEVASSLGLATIQWSVDSLDWKDLSAEQIASRVVKKTEGGSIILAHNNGLHTLESLPLIFSALSPKGIVFRPIGELIYADGYEIAPDGTQKKTKK